MEQDQELLKDVIELFIKKARSFPNYPINELSQEAVNLLSEMNFYAHDEGLTLEDIADKQLKGEL